MIAGAYLVLDAGRSEAAGAFFCSYDGTVVMRLAGVSESECEVAVYRLARKGGEKRWRGVCGRPASQEGSPRLADAANRGTYESPERFRSLALELLQLGQHIHRWGFDAAEKEDGIAAKFPLR